MHIKLILEKYTIVIIKETNATVRRIEMIVMNSRSKIVYSHYAFVCLKANLSILRGYFHQSPVLLEASTAKRTERGKDFKYNYTELCA
jgi:hypothetical protein